MGLIVLLLLPLLAAADCEPVANLWQKRGFTEPLRQEQTSWCFAHAAVNLLSLKTGRRLDPSRLARDFHRSERSQRIDSLLDEKIGGFVSESLKLAYAKGVCESAEDCQRELLRGGVAKEILVKDGVLALRDLDLLLARGEPVALSLDLSFFREKGGFYHSVVVVGREPGEEGCEYIAVDSNHSTEGWKAEFQDRLGGGFLRLTAEEIREHTIRMDFIRGDVSLPKMEQANRVPSSRPKKAAKRPPPVFAPVDLAK